MILLKKYSYCLLAFLIMWPIDPNAQTQIFSSVNYQIGSSVCTINGAVINGTLSWYNETAEASERTEEFGV